MIDYKIVAEQAAAANSRLADKVELLIAQRDELLSALKAIYDRHNAETMAQARNVIAKCEAQ